MNRQSHGGALLAVLWLSAALAAIAFSLAVTVRAETARSSTAADGVRAYYLALGGIERAIQWMLWAQIRNPDNSPRYWTHGQPRLVFDFPSGVTEVEIIPEASKLNLNAIPAQELNLLLLNLGVEPDRAALITQAVVDWRSPAPGGLSPFDAFYLASRPSFRARHASFEETEELLLVRGMTPEIYHGSYVRDAAGKLIAYGGLKHCISVYGSTGAVDVNTAHPALLRTLGISPEVVERLIIRRRALPFRNQQELVDFAQTAGPGFQRLMVGGVVMYTLRAHARLKTPAGLSDLVRSAALLIRFNGPDEDLPFHRLRWYDY
jgi:general secretion pathway protein K